MAKLPISGKADTSFLQKIRRLPSFFKTTGGIVAIVPFIGALVAMTDSVITNSGWIWKAAEWLAPNPFGFLVLLSFFLLAIHIGFKELESKERRNFEETKDLVSLVGSEVNKPIKKIEDLIKQSEIIKVARDEYRALEAKYNRLHNPTRSLNSVSKLCFENMIEKPKVIDQSHQLLKLCDGIETDISSQFYPYSDFGVSQIDVTNTEVDGFLLEKKISEPDTPEHLQQVKYSIRTYLRMKRLVENLELNLKNMADEKRIEMEREIGKL